MQPWKRIEPTTVTQVGHRKIVTKTFEMPDGTTATFDTIAAEASRCVATIALTPDNQVIIARQYRPGPQRILDEIPGGGIEAAEDPCTAASRELPEETGYTAESMALLGEMYIDAYTNTYWSYFLARGCVRNKQGQSLDRDEHVEVHLISIETLLQNALSGKMSDTAAVLLAYEQLQSLKTHNTIKL